MFRQAVRVFRCWLTIGEDDGFAAIMASLPQALPRVNGIEEGLAAKPASVIIGPRKDRTLLKRGKRQIGAKHFASPQPVDVVSQ